eukprot:125949-Rhodomonas_salina.2
MDQGRGSRVQGPGSRVQGPGSRVEEVMAVILHLAEHGGQFGPVPRHDEQPSHQHRLRSPAEIQLVQSLLDKAHVILPAAFSSATSASSCAFFLRRAALSLSPRSDSSPGRASE